MSRLPFLLALAVATSAGAATVPPAGTTLYWSETGPQTRPFVPGPSFIQAGTGLGTPAAAVQAIVSGNRVRGPNGLEAPDGRVWWPDQQLGVLRSVQPDGLGQQTIGVGNPYDLDIDAGVLYFSALNENTIYRVPNPYAAAPDLQPLLTGLSQPSAVDAAGGFVYLSEVAGTDRIRRSNLDGSGAVTLLTGIQSYDFEVTPQYLYLTTTFGDVVRSNLDGSGRVTLASGLGFLNGIDVAGDRIYVSELNGHIKAMGLAGQDVTTIYSAPAGSAIRGVAAVSAVPEPGPAALLLAGLAVVAWRRRGGQVS